MENLQFRMTPPQIAIVYGTAGISVGIVIGSYGMWRVLNILTLGMLLDVDRQAAENEKVARERDEYRRQLRVLGKLPS